MKHKISRTLCWLLLLVYVFVPIAAVSAEGAVDTARNCSLTLYWRGFDGLSVRIYRAGDISADGRFALADAFAGYPVSLEQITTQAEWRTAAGTLGSFVFADSLAPTAEQTTDGNGEVRFCDLRAGLYLVPGVQTERDGTVYAFETFLISVPNRDADGAWQYDVTAVPKYEEQTPSGREREFKVVKLWKEDGNAVRPTSVEVALYRDGVLQSVQVLSAENNWSYRWVAADDGSIWSVTERNVPADYTVTVTENGTAFTVTNTYHPETDSSEPPETGDTRVLWPYVLAMFLAGGVLSVLAAHGRRRADV